MNIDVNNKHIKGLGMIPFTIFAFIWLLSFFEIWFIVALLLTSVMIEIIYRSLIKPVNIFGLSQTARYLMLVSIQLLIVFGLVVFN